ncbi:hypothetical protein [Flavobacterium sp.]|uniref:hypothetical protein n=1 Tax=Flavobacterium sp. TaxID=239 RepID=UPI00262B0A55|nr:hypothetical protein [Flavobacterium sp.]
MSIKEQIKRSNIVTVTGKVSGNINGIKINGTVTGIADRDTGLVENVYHDIDPKIGPQLSRIILGLTIVCANMAVEEGSAKNLDSMTPMQTIKRTVSYKFSSHSMKSIQTVSWPEPNRAEVIMEFSGTLPSLSGKSLPINDVLSVFSKNGSQKILQSGKTHAAFGEKPVPVSVDIKYFIEGNRIAWSKEKFQFLENADNKSTYDEKTKEITFNTKVRMLDTMSIKSK